MAPAARAPAEEILVRLGATDGSPIVWSEAELRATLDAESSHVDAALQLLEREHLVRRRDGAIEIAHDALLTNWTHLASLRLHHMDRLTFLERLREAAIAWERADGHKDFLLRGICSATCSPDEATWSACPSASAASSTRASCAGASSVSCASASASLARSWWPRAFWRRARSTLRATQRRKRARRPSSSQYVDELAAKSRRKGDPYSRAAYIAAAMAKGSTDGTSPLELGVATRSLARADFLTLDEVTGASFPWEDRFLIATGPGGSLVVVDFRPPEPDVIEDLDIDVDPEQAAGRHVKKPRLVELRPHDEPIAEKLPFGFDSAVATRSVSGEIRVFRIREDGSVALAATAPMRCAGAMRVAQDAPVVACPTEQGLARWDLRRGAVDVHPFQGTVADVSPDGERVVASITKRALLWEPGTKSEAVFEAPTPIVLARWSPRARAVAVVEASRVSIVELGPSEKTKAKPLFTIDTTLRAVTVRWDDAGLDLALCSRSGEGQWTYLKRGGRSPADAEPKGHPCAARPRPGQPEPVPSGGPPEVFAGRDLGTHFREGGWKLPRQRYLSRELVLFDASHTAAQRLLAFHGTDDPGHPEEPRDRDSVTLVDRGSDHVVLQIGDETKIYSLDDQTKLFSRRGSAIRRCKDGRLLAWAKEEIFVRVFDALSGAIVGHLRREPRLVLGGTRLARFSTRRASTAR